MSWWARELRSFWREEPFLLICMAGVLLGLIAVLVVGIRNHQAWVRACEARGGHEHSLYKGSVCISPDGRILEDD